MRPGNPGDTTRYNTVRLRGRPHPRVEPIVSELCFVVKEMGFRDDREGMGKKKMKLATWLVSRSLMTVDQAEQVMVEQKKQTGHIKDRFGRIAVKMGYISEAQLNRACLDKEKDELSS
jgi:hypothetical protein